MAIQNAEENGVLNDLLLDMYFRLYTVYMYTDIEFTADGNGYIWRAAEGDNSLYIEKIDNNLYYYYQSY